MAKRNAACAACSRARVFVVMRVEMMYTSDVLAVCGRQGDAVRLAWAAAEAAMSDGEVLVPSDVVKPRCDAEAVESFDECGDVRIDVVPVDLLVDGADVRDAVSRLVDGNDARVLS